MSSITRIWRRRLPQLTDGFGTHTRSGNLILYLDSERHTGGVRDLLRVSRLNVAERERAVVAFTLLRGARSLRNTVTGLIAMMVIAAVAAGVMFLTGGSPKPPVSPPAALIAPSQHVQMHSAVTGSPVDSARQMPSERLTAPSPASDTVRPIPAPTTRRPTAHPTPSASPTGLAPALNVSPMPSTPVGPLVSRLVCADLLVIAGCV